MLADQIGRLANGTLIEKSKDINNVKVVEFDNITEFSAYVARIYEEATKDFHADEHKNGSVLSYMREQFYSANNSVNDILKVYFPEQFGERHFLAYPIGHFFVAVTNMWDSENGGIKIENMNDIAECLYSGALYEKKVGSLITTFNQTKNYFSRATKLNEDLYISDAPMRKMSRQFFRIKVILKNEPRLESEIVMEKAKRLYEYIAEHSDLQKEISNILPDDIISNILNGSLPVFPHEDLGIIVDENELIHYMNHAVLYKEVGDGQYISIKGKLYLFSNKIGFYGGSDTYEILLDDIAAIMEFEGSPIILEVLTNGENLYISTPNTEVLFKVLHTIESSKREDDMKYMKIETTIEKIIEGADLDSYIFYFEDVQHSQISEDMEKQIGILIEKLHKLSTALEKYPDKIEGTHRFSNYYLPETLRLILAHQQYLTAGVSKEQIDKVYIKVMESIDTVITAVERKIDSIYQVATMDTIAKANALQKIMGQDGYVKGEGPLKH